MVACVRRAYAPYVPRIGREPAPMNTNYAALIANGEVHVLELNPREGIRGVLVLRLQRGGMFIENIAVDPDYQRRGLGRRLLAFAEEHARAAGTDEMHLYTNEAMHENIALYQRLGYEIVDRREDEGFHRVFMRKRLMPPSAEFPPASSS